MATCPACSKELPGEFPFCPFCAAPLAGDARIGVNTGEVVTGTAERLATGTR